MTIETLLTLPEVVERTRLGRATIYLMIKNGEFPAGTKIGARRVAWPERVLSEWLESRIEASR